MSWKEFCKLNNVPKRYENALMENLIIPDNETGSFKKKIEKLTERPCNAILLGQSGRGKTHFMFSLLQALFKAGTVSLGEVRFIRSMDLDNQLSLEQNKWKNLDFIKTLSEVEFLFIDDLGMERESSETERYYYDLIDKRTAHEKITIISTNLDWNSLKKVFGERIFSRLKLFKGVIFDGPDLREKEIT